MTTQTQDALRRALIDEALAKVSELGTVGAMKWLAAALAAAEPEDYVLMPRSLTAKNGAKSALIGEFTEPVKQLCQWCNGEPPEFDEDTCDFCDDGEITHQIQISWTNIKRIYAKAVEVLAQPPAGQANNCLPHGLRYQMAPLELTGRQVIHLAAMARDADSLDAVWQIKELEPKSALHDGEACPGGIAAITDGQPGWALLNAGYRAGQAPDHFRDAAEMACHDCLLSADGKHEETCPEAAAGQTTYAGQAQEQQKDAEPKGRWVSDNEWWSDPEPSDKNASLLRRAREALHGMLTKRGYGCGEGSDYQVETHNNRANAKASEVIDAIDAAISQSAGEAG
jgi:hypothetical protein